MFLSVIVTVATSAAYDFKPRLYPKLAQIASRRAVDERRFIELVNPLRAALDMIGKDKLAQPRSELL
jgi:hypothetical protein